METRIKRTQRDYTLAFKLAVVGHVENGDLTYKQAQERYGIQGKSMVLTWLRQGRGGSTFRSSLQGLADDPLKLPPAAAGPVPYRYDKEY